MPELGQVVRVSVTDIGSSGCPQALAIKVRPAPGKRSRDTPALNDFTLGPLMAALDQVEFDDHDDETVVEALMRTRGVFGTDRPPAHPGLVSWSVEAFRNYRAAWRAHQETTSTPCPRPVRVEWVIKHHRDQPDRRGLLTYLQTCWGRRYQSEDGSLREMWLLAFTTPRERPPIVYAAAANVAATGGMTSPERVRVVAFGAMSPVAEQLLEETVEHVHQRARTEVTPRLSEIVDATERRPGGDCAECPLTPGCPEVPMVDLLPDLAPVRGGRWELSVTDLRYHDSCPARYHLLRQLHVRDIETTENQFITIGRTVDIALRNQHAAGFRSSRCRADQPQDEAVLALPEQSRHLATRMLVNHAKLCPYPDVDEHHDEPRDRVVVHDERLGIVFVADPDLLYPRSGGWVWRETKTSSRRLSRDRPLLRQVPQLALAVLIVASGALGRDTGSSRVELEQLRADGCTLEELDPGNPGVLAEARAVIGGMVGRLLADTTFEAVPGKDCVSCEVRRWCTPGSRHVTEQAGAQTS